ncbi:hypothetical protein M569_15843, partial [Genlisea aurea]
LDDPLSCLRNFGISEASLATIASQGEKIDAYEPSNCKAETTDDYLKPSAEESIHLLKVSLDGYESLPKHMKGLASWEELVTAVEKINTHLKNKPANQDDNIIQQNEIESLDLGFKARSYLLLLIKLDGLQVQTDGGGIISYKVL